VLVVLVWLRLGARQHWRCHAPSITALLLTSTVCAPPPHPSHTRTHTRTHTHTHTHTQPAELGTLNALLERADGIPVSDEQVGFGYYDACGVLLADVGTGGDVSVTADFPYGCSSVSTRIVLRSKSFGGCRVDSAPASGSFPSNVSASMLPDGTLQLLFDPFFLPSDEASSFQLIWRTTCDVSACWRAWARTLEVVVAHSSVLASLASLVCARVCVCVCVRAPRAADALPCASHGRCLQCDPVLDLCCDQSTRQVLPAGTVCR
jgi:hypothetical protein